MSKREAGTIFISLQLATAELAAGVATVEKQLQKVSQSAMRMGAQMSIAFTAPLALLGRTAIKSFAEFDQAMAESVAFFGKGSQEMRGELEATATTLSEKTKFSATELAKGFQELGQAGLTASEAIKALPIVANFATAAQTNLAGSTETLIQIQNSLGLKTGDTAKDMQSLTRVADVMARASLDTTNKISDLSTALASQLGGTLRGAKIEIEDAAAALEVLGSQGIKGAKAGTALGIIIRELGIDFLKNSAAFKKYNIQVFDSAGNYLNVIEILKNVDKAFQGLGAAQRLAAIQSLGFTKRNNQFIQLFLGMSGALDKYSQANRNASGATAQIAAEMNKGFGTQLVMLQHSLENVGISIGRSLAPALIFLNTKLVSFAKTWDTLSTASKNCILAIAGFLALVGPITFGVGAITSAILNLGKVLLSTGLLFGRLGATILGFLGGPLTAALVVAAAAVYYFWDDVKAATLAAMNWIVTTVTNVISALVAKLMATANWITNTFNLKFGDDQTAKLIDEATNKIAGKGRATPQDKSNASYTSGLVNGVTGFIKDKFGDTTNAATTAVGNLADALKKKIAPAAADASDALAKLLAGMDEGAKGGKKHQKILEDQAKAVEDLDQAYRKATEKDFAGELQQSIDSAINAGDEQGFGLIREALKNALYEGARVGFEDVVHKAGDTAAAIAKANLAAHAIANKGIQEDDKKLALKQVENQKKAAEDAARSWEQAFSSLSAGLTDIAGHFGVDLSKVFSTLNSSFSGAMGDLMQSIGDVIGLTGKELSGYISAATTVIDATLNASSIDKKNQDNSGTGGAIGAGAGGTIGGIFGGPEGAQLGAQIGQVAGSLIGKLFKWGPQNADTKARHAFANFVEEGFAKLKTVAFFDAQNKLKVSAASKFNFLEGDTSQFNSGALGGDWGDKFKAQGQMAMNVFGGLGNAIEEVLGLTQDVGTQIGFLLTQQFGSNIDNARLLVMQLGLSMDDLIDKLVETGMTGEATWLAVEGQIQGVTEAFKPGLAALGDVGGAMQELIDSGGRGMAAIKGIKDLAVETMEAGGKTLEDLKQKLLAAGTDPAEVDALMAAIQQRGITTLQALAEASNRVGGGIVADFNAASSSVAKTWEEMGKQLEDVSQKLKDIPKAVESSVTLDVTANLSDDARKVLDAGVTPIDIPTVKSADLGVADQGPMTAEAKIPSGVHSRRLARSGSAGSMGGDSYIINVDARNAHAGSEVAIRRAIHDMGDHAVKQAARMIRDSRRV